jgi:ATP-dependent Clp protease ATP-binding subunit ClpA
MSACLAELERIIHKAEQSFGDLNKYTKESQNALETASDLARTHTNAVIYPVHLALALLDPSTNNDFGGSTTSLFGKIVKRAGGSTQSLRKYLLKCIAELPKQDPSSMSRRTTPSLAMASRPLTVVLIAAIDLSNAQNDRYVNLYNMIQAVAQDGQVQSVLKNSNPKVNSIEDAVLRLCGEWRLNSTTAGAGSEKHYLEKHTTDMTALAREGKIDPVIGRGKETDEVIGILSKRTKNNPVIVGEPGVGKTAVVNGLAHRIVNGKVPADLSQCKLLSVNVSSLVAGCKFRGDLDEKLNGLITEIKISTETVVLFLDGIQGAGEQGWEPPAS